MLTVIALGREALEVIATDDAVWGASFDGVIRVSRTDGAIEQLTTEPAFVITASADAVFATTADGVTRIGF